LDLEKQLFDTTKFLGLDRRTTVITYSDGDYGTITLFKAEMCSKDGVRPQKIRPVAGMDSVPKAILRKIQARVDSSKKIILRIGRNELNWTLPRSMDEPFYKIRKNPDSRRGHGLGWRLRQALAISRDYRNCDGVSATVPKCWRGCTLRLLSCVTWSLVTKRADERLGGWLVRSWSGMKAGTPGFLFSRQTTVVG
jgi:hypothetical protein